MSRLYLFLLTGLLSLCCLCACNDGKSTTGTAPETQPVATIPAPANLQYTVRNVYPHDTLSYTQGLLIENGQLIESTGGNPDYSSYKSWVAKIDLKTGKSGPKIPLKETYFGEGVTILHNKLYQLTWTSNIGFVYDAKTFKKLGEFPLKTEGWGITHDSTNLIVSDGSSNLYYLDPNNFSTLKVLGVTDNNGPVNNLNELEFINGYIYANKYQTNYILKIDPSNGQVVGRADLSGILEQFSKENANKDKYRNGEGVLNGIAYDGHTGKLYITGKLWPNLFEISFQ